MKSLLFLLLILVIATFSRADDGGFLFVTFQGERTPLSEQVYFALSKDGRAWEALNGNKPVLVSDVGEKGVRDMYLLRSHDGAKFYLLATDLSVFTHHDWKRNTHAASKSIVIWDSSDLVHWSSPRLVAIAPDDAGCTWAPEAIWDDEAQDYLVYWAGTSGYDNFEKQRIWACHTKDFISFDKPFIYIEREHHVIDADIVRSGDKFYRFSKDETYKAVVMEVGNKLSGPWEIVPNFSLAHLVGYEGPECYQLKSGPGEPATWCLLLDHFSKGTGYAPFTSTDIDGGQFTPATDFKFPYPFRHGSVLPLSSEEYARVNAAYGKDH